ncbi:MAG: cellulose biosynthesis cyclic di-GMP-binding regulatory protein BcsB [Alphaproteobacteria bacterium]
MRRSYAPTPGADKHTALSLGGAVIAGAIALSMIADASGAAETSAVTLRNVGFGQGFAMNGLGGSRTFFFPLPPDVPREHGVLHLHYESNFASYRRAALRIVLNDRPVEVRELSSSQLVDLVNLPLDASDLAGPIVKLDLQFMGAATADSCFDLRIASGFIRFAAETGVRFDFSPEDIRSIRGAWAMLPLDVVIGLSARPLDPDAFWAAWALGVRLMREGHNVTFSRLPAAQNRLAAVGGDGPLSPVPRDPDAAFVAQVRDSLRHVVIASESELATLSDRIEKYNLDPSSEDLPNLVDLGPGDHQVAGNVRLYRFGERPIIAVVGPRTDDVAAFLAGRFRDLTGQAVSVNSAHPARAERTGGGRVTFAQLGFGDQERAVSGSTEWLFPFGVVDLPGGARPTAVNLDLITGPSVGTLPALVHVYYNDVLLRSDKLRESSSVHRVKVELPRRLTRLGNQLKVVLQRNDVATCERSTGFVNAVPAQILGTSTFEFDASPGEPSNFSDLPALVSQRATVYVPRVALERPVLYLRLLTATAQGLMPEPLARSIRFYDDDQPLTPDTPFLLVGRPTATPPSAPVRFDAGAVRITLEGQGTVLDVSARPDLTTAQIAELNDQHGLWISTFGGEITPVPDRMVLDRGDVAFFDASEPVLTFSSREDEVAEITYPPAVRWFDLFQRVRLQAFWVAWLVLTLAFLVVLRRLHVKRRRR